jgi:hypothetical protein
MSPAASPPLFAKAAGSFGRLAAAQAFPEHRTIDFRKRDVPEVAWLCGYKRGVLEQGGFPGRH